ncbi:elongation factor 4 [bacterium]|nr:elongation factor 4 [bacterium]
MKQNRNFCIIAHIDHGKSTLSDRLIQATKTVADRDMREQLLDSMDIERERGITIKMQAVRMDYKANDGNDYILNLIDTPGHVDFSYEVSRSLAACEGALLLVDAAQGIEAQTMANFYLALEHDLEIIPVVNKIDLPAADPDRILAEIEQSFGIPKEECLLCSAKTGQGIEDILEAVIKKVPKPKDSTSEQLKALIYDASYDDYRGVINYVRVFDGVIKKGQKIRLMASKKKVDILECGYFKPKMTPSESINRGGVGYIITGLKSIKDARVGDTVTEDNNPIKEPLAGYQIAKPMVFCGLYPVDTDEYKVLGEALEKLQLNDASLTFETESSQALGFGYRCGFLGLLHMEIIQERIQREFNIEIVVTAPNVTYKVSLNNGDSFNMENPNQYPEVTHIDTIYEPCMGLSVIAPNEYISTIIELVKESRGEFENSEIIDSSRQVLTFEIPLNELITQFFDKLKSRTKGYASMDYWYKDHKPADLVKVDMLINGDMVDALSFIAHRKKASPLARNLAIKLKDIIPRQMFEVAVQGSIGAKVISRETIKAMRKNVTAKCYGGDISRKRKLLEKQKAGKKKMKQIGSVQIPKEAFLSVLKASE